MAYELNQVQTQTFLDRYALEGETKPEQMWDRVATAVASSEENPESIAMDFYHLLKDFKYVPGGRINQAMGNPKEVTAMNCYTIASPEDSRQGIMHSLGEWVEIQSKGGGVGVNISSLRPRGDVVGKVGGTSSGPVNWAQIFTFVSHDIIIQGGSRRGAAMVIMNDDHPDIFEFIHAKEQDKILEGANISVAISDEFMTQVFKDGDWNLKWGGKVYRTIKAKQLWDEIAGAAWKSGEPGVVFMGRINKMANSGYFETISCTNPCSEQPLGDYGACLLGSFNLMKYLVYTAVVSEKPFFDYAAFERDIYTAVRFNDNIIDLTHYPIPETEESEKTIRRMGLGVMGLADVLIRLEYVYGSEEAQRFTSDIYEHLKISAYMASTLLAKERGSFEKFDKVKFLERPFIRQLPSEVRTAIAAHGIRNCYLLTQAPTGTTAMLAGVNSGLEPYYDFSYLRKDRIGEYTVRSSYYEDSKVLDNDGNKKYPCLITAPEVTVEGHILMQAAAQRHIDSAVSKTINAPNSHTIEDVERAYMLAYTQGLKSVAYYRDESRYEQVLHHEKEENLLVEVNDFPVETNNSSALTSGFLKVMPSSTEVQDAESPVTSVRRRLPDNHKAFINHVKIEDQGMHVIVGLYEDGSPGEIWIKMAKPGSTLSGMLDGLGLSLSIGLQHGVPVETLIAKFRNTVFEPYGHTTNKEIPKCTSVLDYLAQLLTKEFVDKPVELPKMKEEDRTTIRPSIDWEKLMDPDPILSPAFVPWNPSDFPTIYRNGVTTSDNSGAMILSKGSVAVSTAASGNYCPICSGKLIREDGCEKCADPDCYFYKC